MTPQQEIIVQHLVRWGIDRDVAIAEVERSHDFSHVRDYEGEKLDAAARAMLPRLLSRSENDVS